MDRITATSLSRAIELLPTVVLWRTYGDATLLLDLWVEFTRQSDLAQVGSITCVVLVSRALVLIGIDVVRGISGLLRKRDDSAGQLAGPTGTE